MRKRFPLTSTSSPSNRPSGTAAARSYFGPSLTGDEKAELIARINHRPEPFCGQEIVSLATIPIYRDNKLHPRHFQLRVSLVPTENGWKMMPGVLLGYAQEEKDVVVSMQRGGASKDTWALRDPEDKEQRDLASVPHHVATVPPRRHHNDLPSRTADNLFWLGRYVERAEGLARVLRVLCRMLINEAGNETYFAASTFLQQIIPPGSDIHE